MTDGCLHARVLFHAEYPRIPDFFERRGDHREDTTRYETRDFILKERFEPLNCDCEMWSHLLQSIMFYIVKLFGTMEMNLKPRYGGVLAKKEKKRPGRMFQSRIESKSKQKTKTKNKRKQRQKISNKPSCTRHACRVSTQTYFSSISTPHRGTPAIHLRFPSQIMSLSRSVIALRHLADVYSLRFVAAWDIGWLHILPWLLWFVF